MSTHAEKILTIATTNFNEHHRKELIDLYQVEEISEENRLQFHVKLKIAACLGVYKKYARNLSKRKRCVPMLDNILSETNRNNSRVLTTPQFLNNCFDMYSLLKQIFTNITANSDNAEEAVGNAFKSTFPATTSSETYLNICKETKTALQNLKTCYKYNTNRIITNKQDDLKKKLAKAYQDPEGPEAHDFNMEIHKKYFDPPDTTPTPFIMIKSGVNSFCSLRNKNKIKMTLKFDDIIKCNNENLESSQLSTTKRQNPSENSKRSSTKLPKPAKKAKKKQRI